MAPGHPQLRTGRGLVWHYRSSTYLDGPELARPAHHPADQTGPVPASGVPGDWEEQLL
jgi:hypothetical protein